MKLNVEVGFRSPELSVEWGFMEYKSNLSADREDFGLVDFKNQAHALTILNDELKDAVERVNKRLLAEGFGKEGFRKPLGGVDENGNPIDVMKYSVY